MMLAEHALRSAGVDVQVAMVTPTLGSLALVLQNTDLIVVAPTRVFDGIGDEETLKFFDCPVSIPKLRETMFWHRRSQYDKPGIWLRETLARLGASLQSKLARH